MVENESVEVVDIVEKNYGDESKSKKTVQVPKTEVKVEEKPEEKLIENKVEPKPEAKKEPEVKTEPKKEKVEVKPENKEIVVEDDFGDLFETKEKLKDVNKLGEKEGKEVPVQDLKRDQEFEAYKKDAETFRSLATTPIGKVLLRAQELGKNPLDILSDIAPKDYTSMSTPDSDSQRATEYFSKIEGLKGEELASAVEEFVSDPESNSKRKFRREQVAELSNFQAHKLKDYQESLESDNNRLHEIYTKKDADIDSLIKEVKKKKGVLYGMQLTDEELTDFAKEAKAFTLMGDDGFIDANVIAASYFFKKYGRQRLRDNYLKAHSKGMEEVLEAVHNVDRNDQTLNNLALEKKVESREAKIEEQYGGVETKQPISKTRN